MVLDLSGTNLFAMVCNGGWELGPLELELRGELSHRVDESWGLQRVAWPLLLPPSCHAQKHEFRVLPGKGKPLLHKGLDKTSDMPYKGHGGDKE